MSSLSAFRASRVAMAAAIHDFDWTSKHRPQSLQDLALTDDLRARFTAFAAQPKLPFPLLLFGPQGTGKTSAALALAHHYFPNEQERVHYIDASVESGNEAAHDLVDFMRAEGGLFRLLDAKYWDLIILSEGSGLSPKAQQTLLDPLEQFGASVSMIVTCNSPDRLIPPFRSRFLTLEMRTPPVRERARVLARVLAAESVVCDMAAVTEFAARFQDLRQMVRVAQEQILVHGSLRAHRQFSDDGVAPRMPMTEPPASCAELRRRLEVFLRSETDALIPTSRLQEILGLPGSEESGGKRIAWCLKQLGVRPKAFSRNGRTVRGYSTADSRLAVAGPLAAIADDSPEEDTPATK